MSQKPLISVIIPTRNRKQKLIRLIKSIEKSNYPLEKIEIIVVDDASTDGTFNMPVKKFPNVKIVRNNKRRMTAGARNVGIKNARGEYLFFVDDDYIIDKNVLSELMDVMETEKVCAAGPVIYYYTDPERIWYAGGRLKKPLYITSFSFQGKKCEEVPITQSRVIECDFLTTPFIVKKQILEEIGFFDERNFPVWGEEIDFSLRIKRKGYRQVIVTKAKVWHDVPTTKDYHLTEERAFFRGRSRVRFTLKYAPPRILLLPIDFLAFCYTLFCHNENSRKLQKLYQYLKGIIYGLAFSQKIDL